MDMEAQKDHWLAQEEQDGVRLRLYWNPFEPVAVSC